MCDVSNNFYVNIVGSDNQQDPICDSNSCEDIVGEFSDHPSVTYIKSNFVRKTFNFQTVTGGDIYNILKSMKRNKATGFDRFWIL